jgi:hypothetical protein
LGYIAFATLAGGADMPDISTIVLALGLLLSIYLGLRKQPHELGNLGGDLITKYQNLVAKSADRETALTIKNEALELRIDNMEIEQRKAIECLEIKLRATNDRLRETNDRLTRVEDHNRRLVAQLESNDIIPVPFDPVKHRVGNTEPHRKDL